MASRIGLNQTESEGNTSDGVGPQMSMNESHLLRTTWFLDNFILNSSVCKQLVANQHKVELVITWRTVLNCLVIIVPPP